MKISVRPVASLNVVIQGVEQNIRTRAYELFLARGKQPGRELEDWQNASAELLQQPRADVSETELQTTIEFHISEEEVRDSEVLASERALLLIGKKTSVSGSRLFKLVPLNRLVDTDSVRAEHNNGRLRCLMNSAQSSLKATA